MLLFIFMVDLTDSYAESYSHDEILTVDEPTPDTVNLEFSDENMLLPKLSEFEVLSYILMSNVSGERWATVTIKNTSPHQRMLDNGHIITIFADGEKRNPMRVSYKFSGKEEVTIVMNFGISKFPILRVEVRN